MKLFIGYYDYTVILTFLSAAASFFGMTQLAAGRPTLAVAALAVAGLCDGFDGKVARTKKNRTEDEKLYGIQLDSMCDVISFGVFPALICFVASGKTLLGGLFCGFYVLCAVIRLSFYNTVETRALQEPPKEKFYFGLPVTTVTIILPLLYLVCGFLPEKAARVIMLLLPLVFGFLFIGNFKLKKPSVKFVIAMTVLVAAALIASFILF